MSGAASFVSVGNLLWGPLGGWASDRYGPKWVILLGLLLLSLGFILVSFASTYLIFILVWGILVGAGWCFACAIPPTKAMINWFTRRSGIAISITFSFSLLSGLVLLPLTAWLITSQGWRHTALIAGIVIAIVGFPLIWFLVKRHRPEYYGLVPDGTPKKKDTDSNQIAGQKVYTNTVGAVELTLRQTLKTRSFWLLMTSVWVSTLAMSIMTVHLVPFLTDMGMSTVKAAGVMSIWLTCAIPSRLAVGFLVDHMKTKNLRFVLAATYIIQALGVAIFLLNKSLPLLYVWFVIYGLGQGANFSAMIPLLPRYFGRKAYGSIDGVRGSLMAPVALVGPIYVGWVYDTTHSYTNVLILFAITLAVAGVVACFMLPPKTPTKVTDKAES